MNVSETIFKKDRFYVRVVNGNGNSVLIPRANYVWLQTNPSFSDVPKGYVIHHLDYDKTNDDPSNLAIMCKYQHVAHHWKQKTIESDIKIIDDDNYLQPRRKPRIFYRKSLKKWIIILLEKNGANNNKEGKRTLMNYKGKPLRTKEEAEAACTEIWEKWRTD